VKTYKNLYPQVWAWDNLYRAYRKARKGKRARAPVAAFEWDLEGNLVRLAHELEWLRPGQYAHACRMVTEIGKLVGGWRNPKTKKPAKAAG